MMWPSALDNAQIMAKSIEMGGLTLAQHTWDVLERIADQRHLHPNLPADYWRWLYWGGFLHDFGKAAAGFQSMLQGERDIEWVNNRHRHEVLSLAFVDWLFGGEHPDRYPVLCVIAAHHKDLKTISDKYGGQRYSTPKPHQQLDSYQRENLIYLANQVDIRVRGLLWEWLNTCGTPWTTELGLCIGQVPKLASYEDAMKTRFETSMFRALLDLNHWRDQLMGHKKLMAIRLRGFVVASDHAASADQGTFVPLELTDEIALRPLHDTYGNLRQLRQHQREAQYSNSSSVILIAPTGSGKTEAAMLWAAAQHEQKSASRLFYTLPYQASMNAMARRLAQRFYDIPLGDARNHTVTIHHSRAVLQFYQDHMDADGDPDAASRMARIRKNKTRLNLYPVKVFSPYQMLKAAYALKGYETLLVDYTDALFIFDEIHAYDPKRLALIITMIGWLRENFAARFFVMTATLPPPIRKALSDALGSHVTITAEQRLYDASQRHTVVRRNGDIRDHLDDIVAQYRNGKAVLVCCNTVDRAQMVYRALKQTVNSEDIRLLHGRFTGKDRAEKEAWLMDRVRTGLECSERKPTVFVATQVVEVSLDVDFDVLFTDPAPLEALLQRFGRVNRGRGESPPLCDVHVFDQPFGEDESKPYDYRYIERALELLQPGPVDESRVDALLAEVYKNDILEAWNQAYLKSAEDFRKTILDEITPLESADDYTRAKFYELFDGRQILPEACMDDYDAAFEKNGGGYLVASQYLVNVSNSQFHKLKFCEHNEDTHIWLTTYPYDAETGLSMEEQDNNV